MAGRVRFSRRVVTLVGVVVAGLVVAGLVMVGASTGGGAGSAVVRSEPSVDGVAGDRGAAPESVPGDPAGARAAASAPASGPAPGPAQSSPPVDVGRALVRTAQLSVDTDDPVAGTRKVRTAVAGAGGSVAEEESTDGGSRLTLRVPAASLDRLIDAVAVLGHVTARSGQVVDATDRMVDLDARVTSQQASVVRVRALLARATSIGDVVAVESELTRREADLDSLTGRLAALRDQVALSTLTVDLSRPVVGVPAPPQAAGFLGGLATGWAGLLAVGSGLGTAVGFLLPFLPVLAVLAGAAWWGRRLVRPRPAVASDGQ